AASVASSDETTRTSTPSCISSATSSAYRYWPCFGKPALDDGIPTFDESPFAQSIDESLPRGLHRDGRIIRQKADAIDFPRLLCSRRERPCGRRAAEQRDELASLHSITSSARPSSGSGTVSPSALAVFRLMISANFVSCWTGRSAGLSPLRMRPV